MIDSYDTSYLLVTRFLRSYSNLFLGVSLHCLKFSRNLGTSPSNNFDHLYLRTRYRLLKPQSIELTSAGARFIIIVTINHERPRYGVKREMWQRKYRPQTSASSTARSSLAMRISNTLEVSNIPRLSSYNLSDLSINTDRVL